MELLAIGLSVIVFVYAIVLYLIYGEWKRKVRLFVVRIKSVMVKTPVFLKKLLKSPGVIAAYRMKLPSKLVWVRDRGRG